MDDLPAEFRHEPALALAAGDDGLDLVEKILKSAAMNLSANGWLFVEVGNSIVHFAQRFPDLDIDMIDFDAGGDGVFAVSQATLAGYF